MALTWPKDQVFNAGIKEKLWKVIADKWIETKKGFRVCLQRREEVKHAWECKS